MSTIGWLRCCPPSDPWNVRVAEREDPAVARDEPVAGAAPRRFDADDRDGERSLRRTVVGGGTEREHRRAELVQARHVVQRGGVRGCARGRAGRVEVPRRDARDDATHDRAHARELLVALPVTELVATRHAVVALAACAVTVARRRTRRRTNRSHRIRTRRTTRCSRCSSAGRSYRTTSCRPSTNPRAPTPAGRCSGRRSRCNRTRSSRNHTTGRHHTTTRRRCRAGGCSATD